MKVLLSWQLWRRLPPDHILPAHKSMRWPDVLWESEVWDIPDPRLDWLLERFPDQLIASMAWYELGGVGGEDIVTYRIFHKDDWNDPAGKWEPLEALAIRALQRG